MMLGVPLPDLMLDGKTTLQRVEEILSYIKKPFERIMIFVDGGYLQKICEGVLGNYLIDFEKLSRAIVNKFKWLPDNPFQPDLIRIYYYDAIVDGGHPDYQNQKDFFDMVESARWFTVRLGNLVESSKKGFKQKGVDVLIAIDALDKAYQQQYDTGIFLMGDRDFLPLIKAVKDAGKKTLIVCDEKTTSTELMACFDRRILLDGDDIKSWAREN